MKPAVGAYGEARLVLATAKLAGAVDQEGYELARAALEEIDLSTPISEAVAKMEHLAGITRSSE